MTLFADLRQAARGFARAPGFTIMAVGTLAVGIAATAAVFSAVNETMFRPLAVRDPDRLVMLWESNEERGWHQTQVAPANALDWRRRVRAFEDVALVSEFVSDVALATGTAAFQVAVSQVSGNAFALLGGVPSLGRGFPIDASGTDPEPALMLSHAAWVRYFGADSSVVGRTVRLDGRDVRVAGVLGEGFRYPVNDAEMWTTFTWSPEQRGAVWFRQAHILRAIARLREDVDVDAASRELATVATSMEREYPQTNRGMKAGLTPLHAFLVGERSFPLLLLLGAVVVLQVVVCANVANLLLARGLARRQEMAVRVALGAGRRRIAGLMLTESALLAVAGGVLGVVLASNGLDALAALRPDELPDLTFRLDGRVLAFTLAMTGASALVFGLYPALATARVDVSRQMADGGRAGSAGRRSLRAAHTLIAIEVALAVVLVTGAGLMVRSVANLRRVDPGVNTANVLTFEIRPPSGTYPTDDAKAQFAQRLIERLRAIPGVRDAGVGRRLPFAGVGWSSDFTVEGWPADRYGVEVRHREVSAGYFRTLEVPLQEGAIFAAQLAAGPPWPVVVNQAFAARYFPNASPVGRRITFNRVSGPASVWYVVVGVVGNERMQLTAEPQPEIIGHLAYDAPGLMQFVVKGHTDLAGLLPALRRAVSESDPEVTAARVRTLEDVARDAMATDRYLMTLLAVFAGMAFLLAAVGVYGVAAQVTRARRREIGIRLALGATPPTVARLLMTRGAGFVAAGIAAGGIVALVGGRLLRTLLFNVQPSDPVTLSAVVLLLALVAVAAMLLPAWRASRLNPVEVLAVG